MAQSVPAAPEPSHRGTAHKPTIVRGADDQAAAYEAWLAQWNDVDADEEERSWQIVKHRLQETRRELGQRLLFPEIEAMRGGSRTMSD